MLNKDPAFEGFFDSRVKFLRERIENYYSQLQNQQYQVMRTESIKENCSRKKRALDISEADIDVCFDTGGTDSRREDQLPQSHVRASLNPEELCSPSYSRQAMVRDDNLLDDLTPVLIQKKDNFYVWSLPFCKATQFQLNCVYKIVAHFMQDAVYRCANEFKRKENVRFSVCTEVSQILKN